MTWNLSDKIYMHDMAKGTFEYMIPKDVKEFIKRLNLLFEEYRTNKYGAVVFTERDRQFIIDLNNLAGDKLK